MKRYLLIAAAVLALPLWAAEDLKMPVNIDKLAERAKETVDVTLDESMLQFASGFLSNEKPDDAEAKKLISKLKGVYVRSFEFDKEGQYAMSDVEAIRQQLKAPVWSRIVSVKGKGENTEVYVHKTGEQIVGMVVLAVEPKELTIVHIDGPINPEELSHLGGHMGIPEMKPNLKDSGKKED